MIQLERTKPGGASYPLLVDQKYTVGRKSGDIIFPDDQSVSRVHAELLVEHAAGNIAEPLLTPTLSVTDMGSKFGTYATEENIVSKTAVDSREPIVIAIGDKLRFGLQFNEYRVNYTPFVATSSSYKVSQAFKADLVKLGGHFISAWTPSVTHVVVDQITLTVKVVCALMAAKPIIKADYVHDLLEAIKNKRPKPDLKDYLPKIGEPAISSVKLEKFLPDHSRTTLFAGKTFLFCHNKHLKKMSAAIVAAGGSVRLIADACNENVLDDNFVIMGSPVEVAECQKDVRIKQTIDAYKSGGKRLITDSEIGLAAVHNSIEKHCNPRVNIAKSVLPPVRSQTQDNFNSDNSVNKTIVPETQPSESQVTALGNSSVYVVNETVNSENSESSQSERSVRGKRGTAEASGGSLPKKRLADEELVKPTVKRSKELDSEAASCSRMSTRSTRSASALRTNTAESQKNKTLNSLFGFSSDEEEEDEGVMSVPESQPQGDDDNVEMVPESQPIVSVVDMKKLQALNGESASVLEDEEDVSLIPCSPAIPSDEEEEVEEPRHGTDFISTVRSSVMNAKTLAVEPKATIEETPLKTTKRHRESDNATVPKEPIPEGSTKKRRREKDTTPEPVDENVKRVTLHDIKQKLDETAPAPTLPVMKKALVNKNLSHDLSILSVCDSQVSVGCKNFKKFRKVLPVFLEKSIYQESRNNSRSRAVGLDISALENVKPVKLKRVDYDVSGLKLEVPDEPAPMFSEDSPPVQVVESDIEMEEDVPVTRGHKRNGKPEPPRPVPESNSDDDDVPSTSSSPVKRQRRTSPRKKAAPEPAVKLRGRKAPPPAEVVDVEEEHEDDEWSFSR